MNFTELALPGAYIIDLLVRSDHRGCFARLFCAKEFEQIKHTKPIVNVNHSFTRKKEAIRGMHFQCPPDCEIKIVKCLRGAVWDCIVDVRKDSPTFLKWEAVVLSENNDRMIYIPEGFAHGFQTMTDDVELLYFHTNHYAPKSEVGLRFDDPTLAIDWPKSSTELSERDKSHPLIEPCFQGITIA